MKNKHLINKLDGKENTSKRYSIEKNDCTVRAYAEAFDIEYSKAHTKLMMHSRQIGHGVVFETFMKKHHPDIQPYPCPHMTDTVEYVKKLTCPYKVTMVKEEDITNEMLTRVRILEDNYNK